MRTVDTPVGKYSVKSKAVHLQSNCSRPRTRIPRALKMLPSIHPSFSFINFIKVFALIFFKIFSILSSNFRKINQKFLIASEYKKQPLEQHHVWLIQNLFIVNYFSILLHESKFFSKFIENFLENISNFLWKFSVLKCYLKFFLNFCDTYFPISLGNVGSSSICSGSVFLVGVDVLLPKFGFCHYINTYFGWSKFVNVNSVSVPTVL